MVNGWCMMLRKEDGWQRHQGRPSTTWRQVKWLGMLLPCDKGRQIVRLRHIWFLWQSSIRESGISVYCLTLVSVITMSACGVCDGAFCSVTVMFVCSVCDSKVCLCVCDVCDGDDLDVCLWAIYQPFTFLITGHLWSISCIIPDAFVSIICYLLTNQIAF